MRKSVRSLVGLAVAASTVLPAAADFTMGNLIDPTVSGLYTPFYSAGFDNIQVDPFADSVAGQFFVSVGVSVNEADPLLARSLYFTFYNVGPVDSMISEIYWDWTDPQVLDPATLAWVGGAGGSESEWFIYPGDTVSPPNVPGWEDLEPNFGDQNGQVVGVLAAADGQPGTNATRGIWDGQYATFRMDLSDEWDTENDTYLYDIGDVFFDLTEGEPSVVDLRFGLHVTRFANPDPQGDTSFSFVSPGGAGGGIPLDPTVVPIPGAASLGLLGFGLIAAARRKARK